MRGKKALFLFLGLGMPVLVFLFLKMFGKNEFDVPAPDVKPAAECGTTDISAYRVHDSVLNTLTNKPFKLFIANFGAASKKLDRIAEAYGPEVIKEELAAVKNQERVTSARICGLFLSEPNTVVLIDEEKRIRGYYEGTDRDELDRLEAEMKIILKKY